MLFVGLRMRDCVPGEKFAKVNKNLLTFKFSVSEYLARYIFKFQIIRKSEPERALFPKLCKVQPLNNTFRGLARACAADDLELGFNAENGQIEIFDNYNPSMPQNMYGLQPKMHHEKPYDHGLFPDHLPLELNSSLHSESYMDELSPKTQSSGHSDLRMGMPHLNGNVVGRYNQPVDVDHYNPMFHGGFLPINHFPVNPVHEFTDFKQSRPSDLLSCDSSVESFDSPLDEMFYGSAGNHSVKLSRKRKASSPGDSPYSDDYKRSSQSSFEIHDSSKKVKLEGPQHPFQHQNPHQHHDIHQQPHQYNTDIRTSSFNSEHLDVHDKSYSFVPVPNNMQNGFVAEVKSNNHFACTECDAVFKVKSYLTRHARKHYKANAFVCPFYDESNGKQLAPGKVGTKCHSTGGFSRKDTYKTHLKALHFIYPPRTKCNERSTTGGRCAGCFDYFDNNVVWFRDHIEAGQCKGFVNSPSQEEGQVKLEADY